MSAPLLSSVWYRVADLKPRLRAHARLYRHLYRGQVWYLLQDPVSNRVHRFTPAARLLIAAMDGKHTVEALWNRACKRLGESAPTQDDVINLLGQLHSADLLQSEATPDASEVFDRGAREQQAQTRRSYMNPLSIRIPLWDPEATLQRFPGLIKWLWSGWGGGLWLLVVIPALLLLPTHWQELTSNFSDRVLATDNILLMWLVFPLIKALHELGHASATKAGGGEVHDMGVMLLVLMPVPYVDASAASVFKSKYRRAVVGAAGMLVEVFVAALAFYLWLLIEPGVGRAVMFNVMLIAGFTTLLFNGNPLLRYDAYYILTDLIETPNLAQRSLLYWQYLFNRYVFRVKETEPPHATAKEKAWFVFYGPASTIYRILVTITIALFVASHYLVVGVVLAVWAVLSMLGMPLVKAGRYILTNPALGEKRPQVMALVLCILAGLAVLLCLVPAPFRSTAEGVVWFADEAMVRAGADGFVSQLLVPPGTPVAKDQPLIALYNPEVAAQVESNQARVAELSAIYSAEFVANKSRASVVLEQLEAEKSVLARARERAASLTVRAGTDGVFVVPDAENLPGRFFKKGEQLGYVVEKGAPLVRVAVSQEAVDRVRLDTNVVSLRHVHFPEQVASGAIFRVTPSGTDNLPSRALSTAGGGKISLDPRDREGGKALQRLFIVDIQLAESPERIFWGERVFIRFTHQMEPLAVQWYRSIRLLLLSQFNI